ncbi:class I SAM-dependent methyltransferase [Actinomadura sp. WMMB 499]|uniref:class I SAM-dependent methyltransferase n=1 Tax=Actinomadura sp. WMMB 499 TaxID=1219491 RepID=UPI001244D2B9|nr:class I SAM-dependent methyltransferase [Actinomadura sp. WMMB 499]QFG21902.1 class I SAM-dependent methyltransferase [Actinomadura sp. WMMB 499]
MPHPATVVPEIASHLKRLLDFVDPHPGDVCLDVARGRGPLPAVLAPRVRRLTAVDAARDGRAFHTGPVRMPGDALEAPAARPRAAEAGHETVRADATALPYPDGSFSLVTARFALYALGDPHDVLRELLRVRRPGGRLIMADLVRGNLAGTSRDRIERLRDPDHPGIPSIARLTEMITTAGGAIRRLDVFTVERPAEPWLADAPDPDAADRVREELLDEVDGGPRTGAKPRIIGGELWFTQTWAHVLLA